MNPFQIAVVWACLLVIAAMLTGMLVRGRARFCRIFTGYLFVMLIVETAVMLWPAVFWTWSFWLFKQVVYDALNIAVAVELAYWIFLGFPGAAQVARGVVFLLLVGTLAAVLVLPMGSDNAWYAMSSIRARLEVGTVWTFTALAGLVRWYRIPLHPMHRAIVFGFVSYLLVFSTAMKLFASTGLQGYLALAQPPAYLAVCCLWAWEAWQPEPETAVDPSVVARLQPWRA